MKELNKQSVLIGAKFKQLRQARGYTQGKVADILGVSSQHYGTLERGINSYSLDNILKLCDFYNVSVMSILGEIRKNDRKRKKECEKLISQIEELGDEHKEVVSHMVKFYRQLEKKLEKEERQATEKQFEEMEEIEEIEEVEEKQEKQKVSIQLEENTRKKSPKAEEMPIKGEAKELTEKSEEGLKVNKEDVSKKMTEANSKDTLEVSKQNEKKDTLEVSKQNEKKDTLEVSKQNEKKDTLEVSKQNKKKDTSKDSNQNEKKDILEVSKKKEKNK